MSSELDLKRQLYPKITIEPEQLKTVECFGNVMLGIQYALGSILHCEKRFSRQAAIDPAIKEYVRQLEMTLHMLQSHPKYIKLLAERTKTIQAQEEASADAAKLKLYAKNIQSIASYIQQTPIDTEDLDIEAFDMYYQDRYINAITNTGSIKFLPHQNKNPKKIIVTNLEELKKKKFIKHILSDTGIDSKGRGQYKGYKELDLIKGTIYVGGTINKYFALIFHTHHEKIDSAEGYLEIERIETMGKSSLIIPDIRIDHMAYIAAKHKQYKI